jgi:GNAT superfamily N-acetyltransferase
MKVDWSAPVEPYSHQERLKNGTEVTVRAACPSDGPKIRRAFEGLNRETIYSRFFGYRRDISDKELRHVTDVDFERDVALLVTTGSGKDEVVVGGATYFGVDAQPGVRSAEVAFTVEEDYQGLGIGACLMRHLTGIAREKGVTQLEAYVLARNLPMLKVFKRSGLPLTMRHQGDVVHLVLELADSKKVENTHPPKGSIP